MIKALRYNTLYIPPARQNQICRKLPNKRLEEGCLKGHGIILVSAPAGYGKTMLISEWVRESNHKCTWLSLDEYDNDPVRFINYLIAAIQEANACFGKSIEERLAEGGNSRGSVIYPYNGAGSKKRSKVSGNLCVDRVCNF